MTNSERHESAIWGDGTVFLCHAKQDSQYARELYERLRDAGHLAWFDEQCLLPGQDWAVEIRDAVARAMALVVLVSRHSVNKIGFVQRELRLAMDAADERPPGTVFIVPLLLDDTELPPSLRKLHSLDMRKPDWFDWLLRSLRAATRSIPRDEPSPECHDCRTAELITLHCDRDTLSTGQTIFVDYQVRLRSPDTLPVVLDARLVGADGCEFTDERWHRVVSLAPGSKAYQHHLLMPLTIPAGIYRLVGTVVSLDGGNQQLAELDSGRLVRIVSP